MWRRHSASASSSVGVISATLHPLLRSLHTPGWKTQQSTRDQRTREQREQDRKARQIDKLPKPEALHDFQYPHEKTVLADHMFQPPVFETELDTPQLFHIASPADFFIYWNCSDFDRTNYPTVPDKDHRTMVPSPACAAWADHRALALKYLSKHSVSPQFVPHVTFEANLAVTFNGTYGMKARRDPETNELLPPPPPPTSLNSRNFWFTSHFGNYIELCELQQEPSIFFTTERPDDDSYYTLLIASPDYPYRTSPALKQTKTSGGFFLHYAVCNLRGGHIHERKHGDVVVSYVPPLPTEDAGTTRHMCMLFKQYHKVSASPCQPTFQQRCNFRLHDERNKKISGWSGMHHVETSLPADPAALTFFSTSWDIQVQEYYEAIGEAEPAYQMDAELEAILRYNSLTRSQLQVRARHQPDGSTNMGTDDKGNLITKQLVQWQPTLPMHGSMASMWSRRTQLGKNNVPVVTKFNQ